jgi:hypothetical protein
MSDSRFHLEVKFEIYGEKFTWSPSLNWSTGECGCDDRITGWFADCHSKAYGKFQDGQHSRIRKEIEAEERAELARLLAKYPPSAATQAKEQ